MLKVLVADDQPAVCTALELLFDLAGIPTVIARTTDEALDLVAREDIGVVLQDMNFRRDAISGEEGASLMRAIRKLDPDVPIVLMTAFTSLEMAVQLIKEGANDYIAKPWDDQRLVATVTNLIRLRQLQQENTRITSQAARAQRELAQRYDLCGLQYASAAMHEVVSLAVRVAGADAPVLVLGPNGSGKERLAAIIEANSRRRGKPFVTVNAGGLPDQLLEAELFGAEAGAFTGATKARVGRFEDADGGTLFLDEIGNLTSSGQMKLLRVLQTGEYQRLGSNTTRKTNVRIISATNANLLRMIADGTFREDLYFRLNVIELVLPPLRERPEDIAVLAEHFLRAQTKDGDPVSFSREAAQAMLEYEWPGNVRELGNRIQRAALVRRGPVISPADLGFVAGASASRASAPQIAPQAADGDERERVEVERALVDARGVVSKAAALLGVSRQALYRRMDRLGIELERRPKS